VPLGDTHDIGIRLIGIADHIEEQGAQLLGGSISLYRLSQFKAHIFYPAVTGETEWAILVDKALIDNARSHPLEFQVVNEEKTQVEVISIALVAEEVGAPRDAAPESRVEGGRLERMIIRGHSLCQHR
jgi:hypothetical protein